MTIRQQRTINDVKDCLGHVRNSLDLVMYSGDPALTDPEYNRVREAYDLICQAIDKL